MENKKRNLIIIFALMASAIIIFAVFLSWKKTETSKPSQETSQQIPELPGSEENNAEQGQNTDELYQDAFEKAKAEKKDLSETNFNAVSGQTIPLNKFVDDLKIKISPYIYNNLDQKAYGVFFCSLSGKSQAMGARFSLIKGIELMKKSAMVTQTEKDLPKWEVSLFQDFQPLLYPNTKLANQAISNFASAEYTSENGLTTVTIRYANAKGANGESLSLDYTFFNENIFVSNSKECLRKIVDLYEDEAES